MQLLFNNILSKALVRKASDIHFIPSENDIYLNLRINDQLIFIETIHPTLYRKLLTFMKYQAGLDVSNHNIAQSGRYLYKYKELYYLRISTLPLSLGIESCVIRIIPQYFKEPNPNTELLELYKLMNKNQGLILLSGPTGSGKSTLMYQLVKYAKDNLNLNIITIEDPVETLIKGITQISINEKAGINYASSFKAILRCDPDIILIGEIRDSAIAKCVLQASLSGHLVLSTIHASNCKGAILRLIEMGCSIQEMHQSLLTVINQRLVTTNNQNRLLIYETLNADDVKYFFEHNNNLPRNFESLNYKLEMMSKEGVIREATLDRYS
ncbi:Flp pilus assembly complex ATPase component TadA [Staphylococcus sp. ACRSN]|uniref:competence type IV pilus ATPase ComGA n=1 Tax=Staphylococcus sp. ACRSN TaxID=2918214 RepID=UPI001EF27423|nr:competence type IV pilus ATPase ComGA [Staphylococcus sp. ACRSN]MCG7338620.1 Flp pilus assembly complex ATPase component TadA [Staphylococcus sp. ACRSN]